MARGIDSGSAEVASAAKGAGTLHSEGRKPFRLELSGEVGDIISLAKPLEDAANKLGIFNVFQDGGYRTLLLLTMFGLSKPTSRSGNDALDPDGKAYELKTINLVGSNGKRLKRYPSVTTEHTLTLNNIERYRKVHRWLIRVFEGNQPLDVWEVASDNLADFFDFWEQKVKAAPNEEVNNPKIPFARVVEKGICHSVIGTESIPRPMPGRYDPPHILASKDASRKKSLRAKRHS